MQGEIMQTYIGGSGDQGKGRKKHDFANLLCGADRIARMAAKLAADESGKELAGGGADEDRKDRNRNAEVR
jgi:hypothetical protein